MLRDVIGGSGLSLFAQMALVLFFVSFVALVVYLLVAHRSKWERARYLPLDEEEPERDGSRDPRGVPPDGKEGES